MPIVSKFSHNATRAIKLGAAGLIASMLAQPAGAIDVPRLDTPSAASSPSVMAAVAQESQTDGSLLVQVRARGGGGGHRGGGGGYRRGYYYGGGLLLAPAIGYGAYSYYNDCRSVRVKEHRCWRDDDGDRHCGTRYVIRRFCD